MPGLTFNDDPGPAWYPVPVKDLDALLHKVVHKGRGYTHSYALRKNLAYNLQYAEYVAQTLADLKLSGVLERQTWKTFIITGCGLIESLLDFLLVARGLHKTTEWEESHRLPGNPKTVNGERVRAEVVVQRKLPAAKRAPMTFDAMLKKAEAKKVLGSQHGVYSTLKRLRPLRNRVHLQAIEAEHDTDWNAFTPRDCALMADTLHAVFTANIFRPSTKEEEYFAYLESLSQELHSRADFMDGLKDDPMLKRPAD